MTALPSPVGATPVARRAALGAVALGIGLLAVLALGFGVSGRDLAAAIRGFPPLAHVAIAATQAALIIFAARKWHLLLLATSDGPQSLGLRQAASATTLGTLAGQVLPLQLVTPAVRAWMARRHGIPVSRAVGTSVFEQLFEVITLLAMAAAGLAASVIGPAPGLMLAGAVLVTLTVLIAPVLGLGAAAIGAADRLDWLVLHRLGQGLRQAQALPRALLAHLMALSVLRYGLLVWLNVQILAWLVPGAPLLPLALAFPLVQAVTALPIVAGGLGITEATWVGLLMASGLPGPEAVGAALALRVVSTAGFLMVAPALVAWGYRGGGRDG